MPRKRKIEPRRVTYTDFAVACTVLAHKIREHGTGERCPGVYGIPRGGVALAQSLAHRLEVPLLNRPAKRMLLVDDIIDSGKTMASFERWSPVSAAWVVRPRLARRYPLHVLVVPAGEWLVFPWEDQEEWETEARARMELKRA